MEKARIGRPRSEKSREAILTATRELLRGTAGAGLTVEAIAGRAGVGKPTIYRWWPSLADIVLEALLSQAEAAIPAPACGSWRETLRRFLGQSIRTINAGAGAHLRFLMSQAQKDAAFRERFRENFVARRRAVLRSILDQAAEGGQIDPGQNLETLVDLVFGAMWYRLLTGHASLDEAFADELTEVVVKLIRPPSA